MRAFDVYKFGTDEILGAFLNVETVNHEVKVWYLSLPDGIIRFAYREDIEIKEVEDFGTC